MSAPSPSGAISTINGSVVALRFHKVASSTFKAALLSSIQPSYMEHDTLPTYKDQGLLGLRCLGAPSANRVLFIALFREPASRLLSALHFYEGLLRGPAQYAYAEIRSDLQFAHKWIRETPCAEYTVGDVNRSLTALSLVSQRQLSGHAGTRMDEYAHYLRVQRRADVRPALEVLRRDFLVGVTEDMESLLGNLVKVVPAGPARAGLESRMRALLNTRYLDNKGHSSYCSVSQVQPSVLHGIRKLVEHDVDIYHGARAIAAEQAAADFAIPWAKFAARDCKYRRSTAQR